MVLKAALLAFAVLAAPAAAQNPWLGGPVLNIAHQGGQDEFPSNTLFAFKRAMAAGADMLELDIGVTKDGQIIVMHDTTVDRVTNGKGIVSTKTLRQIRALDGSYDFKKGGRYPYRGIATGRKKPPRGFGRTDFRVPTLAEVMKAFPDTPINIEIKGRTPEEAVEEYVTNAEVLAAFLESSPRRDLVVVSFKQAAVDRFHELAPAIGVSPGVEGLAGWAFNGVSPGEGVQTFNPPMTYTFGETVIDTTDYIERAHREGYAWHSWFSGDDVDGPSGWAKLISLCADGIMTSRPVRLEAFLKTHPRPASCG